MSARPSRTMSIRKWLVLALAGLFLMPLLTMAVIGVIVFAPTHGPTGISDEIRDTVTRDATSWKDPAWQDALRSRFSGDADIVLVADGREVFRTGDPMASDTTRTIQKITVSRADPVQVAWIYLDIVEGPPRELRQWFVPVALLVVLLLTLAAIGWFLRRSIIQPLESTSDAARKVARGVLDVHLPSSPVREVAQLNDAFQSMSDDLRHSRERRQAMEREREMFVTAIAHDLRTPLFSLRGSLQGLRQGIASTPEQRARYLDLAIDKADQLESLIADLFAFTRIEYMGETPSREALDLGAFLRDIVEGTRPQTGEKGIALSLHGPAAGTSVGIEGDAHLLTRAIENILGNALRHTPEGGEIRIEWDATPGQVTIAITDSGPGFTGEDLPHLFEPLYRGEASRSRKTGGAGLGLTIAQRIITAHGGSLVADNAPSGGARLTITLPR